MYWAPNGTVMGIFIGRGDHLGYTDGMWSAVDGKVCYDATWYGTRPGDEPLALKNCFSYMRDGKKIYHQFSSNKMKSDKGWCLGGSGLGKLKPGNLVAKKHAQLVAKAGKSPKASELE